MSDSSRSEHDTFSLSAAQRLDADCDRFEAAWRAGQRPALEAFLRGVLEPERSALLCELLRVELEYRRRGGEQLLAADYLSRFPTLDPAWLATLLAVPVESTSGATPSTTQPAHVRCPHCHNPIRLTDAQPDEVLCPGCGSNFRLREARATETTTGMRLLGKFQLLERVGLGACGAVWKACDTQLQRTVALKIPHASLLARSDDLERFQREARAAAQLRHPGIVTVHEVAVLEGLPALVSDFIAGVPLKDLLEVRRLTFRESAALVAEIATALDYAHSMGVVHRDIKPANILVEHPQPLPAPNSPTTDDQVACGDLRAVGRPLVADFGLALRQDAEETMTLDGHLLGTPAYMSPEQAALRAHQVDRRSDVYSLGVILYELLCGELPFRGSRAMLLRQVQFEDPRPPRRLNDRIPRDLETICLKCLAKTPGTRYQSAAELAADLRRYLQGEPIHARPERLLARTWRWCRRHPALTVLLAVVTLLLVGGPAVLFWVQELRARQTAAELRLEAEELRWKVAEDRAKAVEEKKAIEKDRQSELVRREAEAALQEAKTLGEKAWTLTEAPHLWENLSQLALAALHRAEVVVAGAGDLAPPELPQRLQRLKEQLETAEQDRQLVAALERIHLETSEAALTRGLTDRSVASRAYSTLLRRHGLVVGEQNLEQAQTWLRSKRPVIQTALFAGLNDWMGVEPKDSPTRRWLVQLVSTTDQDEWRNRLRLAALVGDRGLLEELATGADLQQPPMSLRLLADHLQRLQAGPKAVEFLRRVQGHYPADFWINHQLGMALAKLKGEDPTLRQQALAFLRISLALRPHNSQVHVHLGVVLGLNGEKDAALAAYRKALDLDPNCIPACLHLGQSLQELGKLDEAQVVLEQARVCLQETGKLAEAKEVQAKAQENLEKLGVLTRMATRILQYHCGKCHGPGGTSAGGFGYLFDRTQLLAKAKLVPGDLTASGQRGIWKRLAVNKDHPPEGAPQLSAEQIEILGEWIKAGAHFPKLKQEAHGKNNVGGSPGKQYAILIGIGRYQHAQLNLAYALDDTSALRKVLEERAGIPGERILEMSDRSTSQRQPTLANLRREIPGFLKAVTAKDRLLFYFVGHGFLSGKQACLASADSQTEKLAQTALLTSELRDWLELCPAAVKFLVVDCGHITLPGLHVASAEEIARNFEDSGMVILASSRRNERSWEWNERRHGLFGYWLCRALDGDADSNGDGRLNESEVFRFVSERVSSTASKVLRRTQNPVRILSRESTGVPVLLQFPTP